MLKRILAFVLCFCVIASIGLTTRQEPIREAATQDVVFSETCEYVAATTYVNIRKGPGTEHSRVGIISPNKQIIRIGIGDNGWSKIIYNGSVAYISSKYIKSATYDASKDVSGTKITNVVFELINDHVETTTYVNIRTGPSTNYKRITSLSPGTKLIRIGVGENGWSRVLYNDKVVYISSKYIKAIQSSDQEGEAPVKTETVYATTSVNVRSGPSTSYKILGVLKTGESIERLSTESNGWCKVIYKDTIAYVSGKYLSVNKPATPNTAATYPITYQDDTCKIIIYREWFENAWVYAAHITFTDYTRLSTECANGKYNNGYETTSHASNRVGALLAINGCYSAPYLNYPVVRDGKICNGADRNLWVPAVYSSYNGKLISCWETGGDPSVRGKNLQQLVDDGLVTDTFCFGPPGMTDGVITDTNTSGRAQRTFIGTNGNAGDIWLCVSDGRYNDGVSAGLTGNQCMRYLESKGCTFGVNLDGGGSSTFVWKGQVLNAARGNQRAVVDFVCFK